MKLSLYILIAIFATSCMLFPKYVPPPALYERYVYDIFGEGEFLFEIISVVKINNEITKKDTIKSMRIAFEIADTSIYIINDLDTIFKGHSIRSLDGKEKKIFFLPCQGKIETTQDRTPIINRSYWTYNIERYNRYNEFAHQILPYKKILHMFNSVTFQHAIIENNKIMFTKEYKSERVPDKIHYKTDTLILYRK